MKLHWLPAAFEDIDRLYQLLLEKNPSAAAEAIKAILEGSELLIKMPEIGRPMDDDSGRRELLTPFGAGAYVLRYRLSADAIIVIRVWHSREYRG